MNIPNVTETRKLSEEAVRQEEVDAVLNSLCKRILYAAKRGKKQTHISISSLNEVERALVKKEIETKGYRYDTMDREVTATVMW